MIRNYTDKDYSLVKSWWDSFEEPAPNEDMLPTESTFIYEVKGIPALCVTLYFTNTKQFCMIDNFVRNPSFDDKNRRHAIKELLAYITNVAKDNGYKSVMCMGYRPCTIKLYKELGFTQTMSGVSTFIREVK